MFWLGIGIALGVVVLVAVPLITLRLIAVALRTDAREYLER